MATTETFERVRGGSSLHDEEKPDLCRDGNVFNHARWRVVKCDNSETDIIECSRCGKQMESACTFDDDYA
jgi:hypothetical protein